MLCQSGNPRAGLVSRAGVRRAVIAPIVGSLARTAARRGGYAAPGVKNSGGDAELGAWFRRVIGLGELVDLLLVGTDATNGFREIVFREFKQAVPGILRRNIGFLGNF